MQNKKQCWLIIKENGSKYQKNCWQMNVLPLKSPVLKKLLVVATLIESFSRLILFYILVRWVGSKIKGKTDNIQLKKMLLSSSMQYHLCRYQLSYLSLSALMLMYLNCLVNQTKFKVCCKKVTITLLGKQIYCWNTLYYRP